MKKSVPAANPDAYVDGLSGWQRVTTESLRAAVKAAGKDLVEVIRWGHLVYFSNGPVLLIRAEEKRVLFGFLRGKRLQGIEARLKPGGKYELATMELHEGDEVSSVIARRLTREATRLNDVHGDPTKAPKVSKAKARTRVKAKPELKRAAPRSVR
jgi:hypothetical protein